MSLKRKIEYKREQFLEAWSRFKLLFLSYPLLLIVWIVINTKYKHTSSVGFWQNWFASFTEDLIFFLIALLGIILSSRMPKDENFSTRVGSLCNNKDASREAQEFLQEEVKRLMTYNPWHKVKIKLKRLDKAKKHVYVHVDSKCEIFNMSKDASIPFSTTSYVSPGPKIDGTYGSVNFHSLKIKNKKKDTFQKKIIKHFIQKGEIKMIEEIEGYHYSQNLQVHIDGHETAITHLCYAIWVPINGDKDDYENNWLFKEITNYTQDFSYLIKNEVEGVDFNYEIRYPERTFKSDFDIDNTKFIADNGEIVSGTEVYKNVASHLKFKKNDRFQIYFSTLDAENKSLTSTTKGENNHGNDYSRPRRRKWRGLRKLTMSPPFNGGLFKY